ncbi:hypothetical protein H5410_003049 [Solanum commersonii]|uniref:Uncharacterized protein n=1 Tax=Solanum commersonii TaxID=4109 RepID=A0A9J6B3X5_SOLCO|nr:hypothetical protein H5410_003049 [Solanum commersonii]
MNTGDCSPGEEVHLTAISSKMDGPITENKNFDEQVTKKSKSDGNTAIRNYSMEEEVHLTNISINIAQKNHQEAIQAILVNYSTNQQIEFEELNCETEANQQRTYSQDHAGPNGQKQDLHSMEKQKIYMNLKQRDTRLSQDQNDQHGNTKSTTLEVIEVGSSSHFSFGAKPMDTIPSNRGQQRPGKSSQSNSSRNVVSLSSSDYHVNANAKGQKNGMLNDQEQGRGNMESQQ